MRLLPLGTALLIGSLFVPSAFANEPAREPKKIDWSFSGPFGTIDKPSAQRGLQVYREVCAACHSIHRVAFRSLRELGFSEAEVKALAAQYQIQDGPNDQGEMFMRPGKPSDHFPLTYPNEEAARAANGGAYPPDQSLLVKAREDGDDYIHALLTGYKETPPKDHEIPEGKYYNPYFPGGNIAMPPPLTTAGQVQYADGTEASVDQMSKDVVTFLEWTAEPEQDVRKQMGLKVVGFLAITCVFFFFAKRKIWSDLH